MGGLTQPPVRVAAERVPSAPRTGGPARRGIPPDGAEARPRPAVGGGAKPRSAGQGGRLQPQDEPGERPQDGPHLGRRAERAAPAAAISAFGSTYWFDDLLMSCIRFGRWTWMLRSDETVHGDEATIGGVWEEETNKGTFLTS